jgi:protein-tyrosine phosphatase
MPRLQSGTQQDMDDFMQQVYCDFPTKHQSAFGKFMKEAEAGRALLHGLGSVRLRHHAVVVGAFCGTGHDPGQLSGIESPEPATLPRPVGSPGITGNFA